MSGERARAAAAIFHPGRLRLARQAAGLRKIQLAEKIEVSPAVIGQYENAVTKPSAGVLARLALALDVPVEFFANDGRPIADTDTSRAFFRSLRSTRLAERERALARAELVWEIFEALQQRVRFPAVDLPSNLVAADQVSPSDVEDRADALRRNWGISEGPIANVVRLLETHGVIVTRLSAETDRVNAFSRWYGDRPLVVLSTDKNDKALSRFDAAHELGHLVLHPDPEPGSHLLEHQAQTFAAAFLMPRDTIRSHLPRRADWNRLLELKQTWGVSIQALLYRCRTLQTLSEPAYRRAMTTLSGFGWRRNEPGNLGIPEQPVMLQRAVSLLQDRGYLVEDLAAETCLPPKLIREIIPGDPATATLSLDPSRESEFR